MIWIFRLVAAVIFGVFASAGFTSLLRFYEIAARDATRGIRTPIDRERLARGIGAWAREAGMWLATGACAPLGFLPRPRIRSGAWLPVAGEKRFGRPVVLVPGYSLSRASFLLLKSRLELSHRPVLALDFPSHKTIEESCDTLAAGVMELKNATGSDKVDLICHSRGGLVARWWIHKLGGAAHVERVVTLGTPHGGTRIAAFGIGPSMLQMFPGSELIRTLSGIPLDPRVTFYSVNAEVDTFVLPQGNDELPSPGRNIRIPGVGHLGLLLSAAAWAQMHAALRRTAEDDFVITGFEDESQDQAAERAIAGFGR